MGLNKKKIQLQEEITLGERNIIPDLGSNIKEYHLCKHSRDC